MKRVLPLLLVIVFATGYNDANHAAAAPAGAPPSAVGISIVGPVYLYPRTGCDWMAYATGGTAPYTYSWTTSIQAIGTPTAYLWSGYFTGTGTLTVTVTDALGATDTDTHTVTNRNDPWDMCP